jgi:hypothetical protein
MLRLQLCDDMPPPAVNHARAALAVMPTTYREVNATDGWDDAPEQLQEGVSQLQLQTQGTAYLCQRLTCSQTY